MIKGDPYTQVCATQAGNHISITAEAGRRGDFNIHSGVFTAGYGGTYKVTYSGVTGDGEFDGEWIYLELNGEKVEWSELWLPRGDNNAPSGSRVMVLVLNKGDSLKLVTDTLFISSEDRAGRNIGLCVSLVEI